MMGHYVVNLEAGNALKVINALKELDQASSKRIAEVTNLARGTISSIIKALCEAKMIHISAWEMNRTVMMTRIYKWGPGKDVPEPVYIPKAKRANPRYAGMPCARADIAAAWLRNPI